MIKSASRSSLVEDVKYTSMSAGVVPSSEYLISTTVLDTATPSVTFDVSSFAGVYRHLQIVAVAKSNTTTFDNSAVTISINGTGINRSHSLFGTGSSVFSATDSPIGFIANIASSRSDMTNRYSPFIADILDAYSSTKNKTIKSFSGTNGADVPYVQLISGLRTSTASVENITLALNSGSFVAGSRFSIYGVTA